MEYGGDVVSNIEAERREKEYLDEGNKVL